MKKLQTGLFVTLLAFSLLSSCGNNQNSRNAGDDNVISSPVAESSVEQKAQNQDVNNSTENLKSFIKQKKPISEINPFLKNFIQQYKTLSSVNQLQQNTEFNKTIEELDNLQNKLDLNRNKRNIKQIQEQLLKSGDYKGEIDGKLTPIIENAIISFLNKKIEFLESNINNISSSVKPPNNTGITNHNTPSNPAKPDFNAGGNFFLYLLASVLASILTIACLGWQNHDSFRIIETINEKISKLQKESFEGINSSSPENTSLREISSLSEERLEEIYQQMNQLNQWLKIAQVNINPRSEGQSVDQKNSLKNEDLNSQIEQLKKDKDDLNSQILSLQSQIQTIENDKDQLQAELNEIHRQKQESEQRLNILQQNWQQERGRQQQQWQQEYDQLKTQLTQAREEKERIYRELIDIQDENRSLATKNQILEKRLKDLQIPPDAKPEALSPEIAQLVNTYNLNPNSLKQYASTAVDVDEDSYAKYRRDDREQVILKTLSSGSSKYLIVSPTGVSSSYLLFPKEKAVSQAQSGPVQALFRCYGFQVGIEFKLKKPAQVSPIGGVSQQEWRLEKQGELEFIS